MPFFHLKKTIDPINKLLQFGVDPAIEFFSKHLNSIICKGVVIFCLSSIAELKCTFAPFYI